MNVRRACLALPLTVTMLAAPLSAALAQEAPPDETAPQRVLFVGNSHTARNGGLDWLVENMVAAEETPHPFDGDTQTEGGVTLEYHWQNGAVERISAGDFDTVVLQGYLPASSTGTVEPFLEYGRLLDRAIAGSGARTVFFMTWPRGFEDWSTLEDVVAAHRQIADELGAPVAPAALAFEKSRTERPELDLIGEDQVHATREGAYLAAATVYATIFERSPEGLGYRFGVSPEDAAFLQRIAWESVLDWKAGATR